MGHRGARLLAPENTFASARTMLAEGGAMIELDIRQSRDGVLYILHDADVDRTTDGTGPISDMTSRDIDQLDAGTWFSAHFSGERVPRLDQFLDIFKDQCAGFYLEVKWADCCAIAALAKRLDIHERCVTFSFNKKMTQHLKTQTPKIPRLLFWNEAGSVQAILDDDAQVAVFFDQDLDADPEGAAIKACHDAKLATMFYSETWQPHRFSQILDWGVTYANLDHVSDLVALRDKKQKGQAHAT